MSKIRVSTIAHFDLDGHPERGVFFNARVACLSPEDKCEVLLHDLSYPYPKRAIIVRRVVADMQHQVRPCHLALVATLSARLQALTGKERVTCAMILLEIGENLPERFLSPLLDELVVSANGNIRKQVYRRFRARPGLGLPDAILTSWRRFGDFEASRLLIDRADLEVLAQSFSDLEQAVAAEGWLLARLYLRFRGAAPAKLSRLSAVDGITHAYVAAKLGKRIPERQLLTVYRERMFDDRSGLLVWSAGQMGLWRAVCRMQDLRENPPDEVTAAYYQSLGIAPSLDLRPTP